MKGNITYCECFTEMLEQDVLISLNYRQMIQLITKSLIKEKEKNKTNEKF